MQQQTGHSARNNLYAPAGPPTDAPYPYTNMASYGSAPPYTSSPSYYADSASHQTAPQVPPFVPLQPSLADAMASLNLSGQGSYSQTSSNASGQGSYAPPQVPASAPAPVLNAQAAASYAPTVLSYDQSYGTGAPTMPQGPLHSQTAPSQPPSYVPPSFSDVMPIPQADSGPLPSYFGVSYHSSSPSAYEQFPPLLGSYDTSSQHLSTSKPGYDSPAMTAVGSVYGSPSSASQPYGASQQGTQGYDYSSSSQYGFCDQVGGIQNRDYEGLAYGQTPAYDTTYYDKPGGHDKGPSKSGYDYDDFGLGDVYPYDGGNVEPYGARGTGTGGSWEALDSYSSGSFNSFGDSGGSKLRKAVPKVETEEKNSGVQKYRVKMLSDASSSGPQDVLCQIGLDGVRMISPSTGKTVRIYSLETITRWEVNEPSVFTFWAKSTVDPEPRRIRLQSGSYTTNAILDTLTAACVQFSEMVGKVESSKSSSDTDKSADQTSEKRRPNFANWIPLRNRQLAPEEKQHWVPDETVTKCSACSSEFGAFFRRHHCRNCGDVFCDKCTYGRTALTTDEGAPIVRVCDRCLAEVTQRLSNAKEISSRPVSASLTHEDLAKKLQEEMERNSSKRSTTTSSSTGGKDGSGPTSVLNCSACGSISLMNGSSSLCPACGADSSRHGKDIGSSFRGSSSWSSSDGSSKRMREVECPTCTVHLQVQVPSSGTETVECGVCQHPFLVSAH